ncbi:MAG TPA: biosynthetic peptidoglycan transglycosylase, partial [Kofleriaceae bacterium]|nr:biosynthetic peptidoglycan transglycosylase [Kofleriaceae bacterium]
RTTVGPKTTADEVLITAEMDHPRATAVVAVSGGALSLWPGMSLTGIAGSLTEGDRPGRLAVDFAGGYGGVDGRLWQASGWVDPQSRGASLALTAERFTFDRIAPILKKSVVVDYQHTLVDASLHIDVAEGQAALEGHFGVSGLNVSHPMLASKPVRDIEVGGDISGWFDQATRTLTIEKAHLRSRGVDYKIEATAQMPGGALPGGARRQRWHVGGRFDIPALPCQKMLDGIPSELIPYIKDADLDGVFDTSIHFDIDWADLQATQLGGRVGIWGCRVRRMPGESSSGRLRDTFTHYVEVERGEWLAFDVGPSNPDFVPIGEVSPYLIKSLLTTEDGSFYHHRGFIKSEFKSALIRNLETGYFSYGASSITMQMVKNVMLYSEKTLSRKLQELFLTWYVEQGLSKDRILEIYVNVIEYGPGLYGIGPAARRYFGKSARDLNPVEAAFFSSILPNPKGRYRQYCEDKLSKYTVTKIARILELMYKRGHITAEEYELAKNTPLVFDRAGAGSLDECKAQIYRAVKNARPTNPMKK